MTTTCGMTTTCRLPHSAGSTASAWVRGRLEVWQSTTVESFLQEVPEAEQAPLLRELLLIDIVYRRKRGEEPKPRSMKSAFLLTAR